MLSMYSSAILGRAEDQISRYIGIWEKFDGETFGQKILTDRELPDLLWKIVFEGKKFIVHFLS